MTRLSEENALGITKMVQKLSSSGARSSHFPTSDGSDTDSDHEEPAKPLTICQCLPKGGLVLEVLRPRYESGGWSNKIRSEISMAATLCPWMDAAAERKRFHTRGWKVVIYPHPSEVFLCLHEKYSESPHNLTSFSGVYYAPDWMVISLL